MAQIMRAKEINPSLRSSVDPGYEYVKRHTASLSRLLQHTDIVFLSFSEAQHLVGGGDIKGRLWIERLSDFGSRTRIIVVKGRTRHTLVHQVNGRPLSRTFWHPGIGITRIRNDIGAGDVFAGGFIAGLLMDELIAHQPAAVRLGAILAAERLKSHAFPTSAIATATATYLSGNQRDERLNRRQRWSVLLERYAPIITAFLVGVLSSALVALML